MITNDDLESLKEKNRNWDIEFNKVKEIIFEARKTEKTDILKSIELYESVKNTNYGNWNSVERLIILYRKTRQYEKELQHLKYYLEDLQNQEYNRKEFLKNRFPSEAEDIERCFNENLEYVTPELVHINFHSKIEKVKIQIDKKQIQIDKKNTI